MCLSTHRVAPSRRGQITAPCIHGDGWDARHKLSHKVVQDGCPVSRHCIFSNQPHYENVQYIYSGENTAPEGTLPHEKYVVCVVYL